MFLFYQHQHFEEVDKKERDDETKRQAAEETKQEYVKAMKGVVKQAATDDSNRKLIIMYFNLKFPKLLIYIYEKMQCFANEIRFKGFYKFLPSTKKQPMVVLPENEMEVDWTYETPAWKIAY